MSLFRKEKPGWERIADELIRGAVLGEDETQTKARLFREGRRRTAGQAESLSRSSGASTQQSGPVQKVPCSGCGALILPTTAARTGGLCMPCSTGQRVRKQPPGQSKSGTEEPRSTPAPDLPNIIPGQTPTPEPVMDDIRFSCPACGAKLAIEAAAAGLSVPCPECSKPILIPETSTRPPKLPDADKDRRESQASCDAVGMHSDRGDQGPNSPSGSHVVVNCPNPHCSQMLRLPSGSRSLQVTCPTCKVSFPYVPRKGEQDTAPLSLRTRLQKYAESDIPNGWTRFGSDPLLFHLWHPSEWTRDTERGLSLRPSFSNQVWETPSHFIWSPGVTVLPRRLNAGFSGDALFNVLTEDLTAMYEGMNLRVKSQETFDHRGQRTACYHFLFERAKTTWETWLLWKPYKDMLFWVDAVGKPEDMKTHEEVLGQVLASFAVFDNREAYEAAGTQKTPVPSYDSLPESETVGILFSIDAIASGTYGRVVQETCLALLELTRIPGTRVSVGDIMPDASYFCVKFETPSPIAAKYVRSVFGPDCALQIVAPLSQRFISGGALKGQPLVQKGVITGNGKYQGGEWY